MPAHRTPDIGLTVLVLRNGVWTEDWVCMLRVCKGKNCQDDEFGVLWWGKADCRHRPGEDVWKHKDV